MIIAVDFDGTIVTNEFPEIGKPNLELINWLVERRSKGDKLILWTCRCGNYLKEAILASSRFGLTFDAVNDNLPEVKAKFLSDCRKVVADIYVDDRGITPEDLLKVVSKTKSALENLKI